MFVTTSVCSKLLRGIVTERARVCYKLTHACTWIGTYAHAYVHVHVACACARVIGEAGRDTMSGATLCATPAARDDPASSTGSAPRPSPTRGPGAPEWSG